jgi:thiol-disulfide isomerase/thioredoxin
MKKFTFFSLFLLMTTLFLSCSGQNSNAEDKDRGYIVKVGDMAPNFIATLTDGTTFKLTENRGKVVMLQFTASWCSVCRKEM